MSRLAPDEVASLFLALAVLLGVARLLGEVVRRIGQPAVLGEIVAGVLLGPTVFGRLAPDLAARVIPREGSAALVIDGISTLAVALFLLVAGMEVELQRVRRQSRVALAVSVAGIAVPFALGYAIAYLAPGLIGGPDQAHPEVLPLFFATALSISSLPVIARTLIDLQLFRTDLGMTVIAAAIMQDLVGWIVFAVILSLIGTHHGLPIIAVVGMTLGFAVFALTALRWLVHRLLPWVQAHASWPGGVLGAALVLSLLGAAATEWIGVHAIFGTFLVGVAIGDSPHLREQTRTTLEQFISFIFAPLFFASVGLRVDFVAAFDLPLVLVVLVVACVGKLLGCGLGARLAGTPSHEAWAIGFAMNARGAMEIVLGLLALQHRLIDEALFVALVVMALVTSMLSGPLMQRFLRQPRPQHFRDYLAPRTFVRRLEAGNRDDAIRELARAVAPATALQTDLIARASIEREELMPTGLGHGVAVPTARLAGLEQPIVAIGLSPGGVDFDAADGRPAQIVVMSVVPEKDQGAQRAILADLARSFASDELRDRVLEANSYTELLAALNQGEKKAGGPPPGGATGSDRRGLLIIGAGPLARAIAKKVVALDRPVWLVDSNPERCAAATQEGLPTVHGDALRDVVLARAHAAEAGAVLAITHNPLVDAAAAALARRELQVPEAYAWTPQPGTAAEDVHPAFFGPIDLEAWDDRLELDQAEWQQVQVTRDDPSLLAALTRMVGDAPVLPALLVRDGVPHVVHPGLEARPGDVLHALVHRHGVPVRPLEALVHAATYLDLDAPIALNDLLRVASKELAPRLEQDIDALTAFLIQAERTTPLGCLALTRAVVPGADRLALLVARARHGIVLPAQQPGISGLLVVVGTEDRRSEVVRTVAELARLIIGDDDLERRWLDAPSRAELRDVLLHSAAPAA